MRCDSLTLLSFIAHFFKLYISFVQHYCSLDRNISELLAYLERPDLHPFERAEALNNMRGIIAAIWGSDEIR